jgi:hypothetical protein
MFQVTVGVEAGGARGGGFLNACTTQDALWVAATGVVHYKGVGGDGAGAFAACGADYERRMRKSEYNMLRAARMEPTPRRT